MAARIDVFERIVPHRAVAIEVLGIQRIGPEHIGGDEPAQHRVIEPRVAIIAPRAVIEFLPRILVRVIDRRAGDVGAGLAEGVIGQRLKVVAVDIRDHAGRAQIISVIKVEAAEVPRRGRAHDLLHPTAIAV